VRLEPIGRAKYGSLRVRGGKSRYAKRVISLTQRAAELLAARKREAVDQSVFSSGTGKPYRDTYLARLQQGVREKLGWSNEFVIHSLRHTMLTRLGEAGVDAFTIMRIAGHSSITVSQRYVHPTPESLENAFEKLENYSRTAITQASEVATLPLQSAVNTQARALSTAVSAADS
jgi:integrase